MFVFYFNIFICDLLHSLLYMSFFQSQQVFCKILNIFKFSTDNTSQTLCTSKNQPKIPDTKKCCKIYNTFPMNFASLFIRQYF